MVNEITVHDYLDNLEIDKNKLINSVKKIDENVSDTDTFTEVISKIGNVKEKAESIMFYDDADFIKNLTAGSGSSAMITSIIKNFPDEVTLPFKIRYDNTGMFRNWTGEKIPKILNIDECIDANSFCSSCSNLKEVPYLDFKNAEKGGAMFNNCFSLEKIDGVNLPLVKSISSMFNYCYKIKEIPIINTPNIDDLNIFCYECRELIKVNKLSSNKIIKSLKSSFYNCRSLQELDLGGLYIVSTTDITNMLYNVPTTCLITVKNQDAYDTLKAAYPNHNIVIKDLERINLIVPNDKINLNIHSTCQVTVDYDGGTEEQKGVTLSVEGPATIDENGLVTFNEGATAGDEVVINAVSTYDSSIIGTKTLNLYRSERVIDINLNDGQYVETEEIIDNNIVYKTNKCIKGSKYKRSLSRITVKGYSKFTIYAKVGNFMTDKMGSYPLDTFADIENPNNNRVFGKELNDYGGGWKNYTYIIDDPTIEHTIDIVAYTPYNDSDPVAYFYINTNESD